MFGKYELVSSDNHDKYLVAIGIGRAFRVVAETDNPIIEFVDNGDGKFTQRIITEFHTIENLNFEAGEEFDEILYNKEAKSTITFDGNKIIQAQSFTIQGTSAQIIYEFSDEENMTATYKANNGVTSVRKYKKMK